MDKLISKFYFDYGKFCNWRTLPSIMDGMKPAERRVLLSVYQIAKDKFVKSARIDGHCIGHFHPHGSVYKTLIQMVRNNFVLGKGNWGCDLGIEKSNAAAMRYTEARLNPNMIDLVFKLINYVPWKSFDLDKEPLYLPTKYPICLLGSEYTIGIGFGYITTIPCYQVEDLYKRLLYLLKVRKRKPIIRPKTDCEILSSDEELESLLEIGKAKIKLKGKIEVDVKNYKVTLRSWPPGVTWIYILKKLNTEFNQNEINWNDLSGGETGTEIIFSITKQRNKKKLLVNFISKLESIITSNISFDTVVIDIDKKPRRSSIDELLLKLYENYMKSTNIMLNSEINRLTELKIEYEILLKLRPFLSKHMNKIKSDFNKTISTISKESKIPETTIKLLFSKYKINKLLSLNVDLKNLKNIKNYVLKEYEL